MIFFSWQIFVGNEQTILLDSEIRAGGQRMSRFFKKNFRPFRGALTKKNYGTPWPLLALTWAASVELMLPLTLMSERKLALVTA